MISIFTTLRCPDGPIFLGVMPAAGFSSHLRVKYLLCLRQACKLTIAAPSLGARLAACQNYICACLCLRQASYVCRIPARVQIILIMPAASPMPAAGSEANYICICVSNRRQMGADYACSRQYDTLMTNIQGQRPVIYACPRADGYHLCLRQAFYHGRLDDGQNPSACQINPHH